MDTILENKKNTPVRKKDTAVKKKDATKSSNGVDASNVKDDNSKKDTSSKYDILNLLLADYKPILKDDDEDNYDNIKEGASKKFVPSKNKTQPSSQKDLYTVINSLQSHYKCVFETYKFFKTLKLDSMTSKKSNFWLNLLSNRIFSSFQELSKLSMFASSNSDIKDSLSQFYKQEDVFSECTMFAYDLYSLIRLVQYQKNNDRKSTNNKHFKFRSKEFDSIKFIRDSEIKRLDSKSTKTLSNGESSNLSDFKNERLYMEGYKSQIRLNNLTKELSNDLDKTLIKSSQALNGIIFGK